MSKREERAITIPWMEEAASDQALEGLFVAPAEGSDAGALIAAPHPLYGGSMDSPVVSELAWACGRAGLASLRFNWRGVGASTGTPSGELADAEADVEAALAQLAESVPGELVGCGYSFGAAALARVATREPRMRRLVLVAPPPGLLPEELVRELDASLLLLVGSRDPIAPAAALERLAAAHPRARFVEIPEADHFFGAGLAELGSQVIRWLEAD